MGGASTSEVAPLVPGEARSVLAPLGILLPGPAALERACGVALASRAALLLRRAGCERVVRLSSPGNEGKEAARLPRAGWVETGTALPENGTAIVVLGDVVLDALLLRSLAESARRGEPALARTAGGLVLACPTREALPVCAAYEQGGVERALGALALLERAPEAGLLLPASTASERRQASRALLLATAKAEDGPLTSLFERRISQAISSVLIPLPISPNAVTTVSLAIGLAGAFLLATTDYALRAIGAATFVFATIVDGCDGEIARAKLLESRAGKVYDTAVDIVVNLAVFLGLATGVWRELEGTSEVRNAVLLLIVGGALAMAVVETVRRIVPSPEPASVLGRTHAWVERFATMEWCYLVLAFALAGQLAFFFFGAAIGANVFAVLYMILGAIAWRQR